jgi:hypothetical protein
VRILSKLLRVLSKRDRTKWWVSSIISKRMKKQANLIN